MSSVLCAFFLCILDDFPAENRLFFCPFVKVSKVSLFFLRIFLSNPKDLALNQRGNFPQKRVIGVKNLSALPLLGIGMGTNLGDFIPQPQEILKALRLLPGIAQQRRRMIGAHHMYAASDKPLSVLLGDPKIGGDDTAGCNPTQTDQNLWTDDGHLAAQITDAAFLFLRQRFPVVGRAAFDDIGNIDIPVSVQIHHRQQPVQHLAAPAYKGFPLQILILSRALPDEHHLCVRLTHAEHYVVPPLTELAGRTGKSLLF